MYPTGAPNIHNSTKELRSEIYYTMQLTDLTFLLLLHRFFLERLTPLVSWDALNMLQSREWAVRLWLEPYPATCMQHILGSYWAISGESAAKRHFRPSIWTWTNRYIQCVSRKNIKHGRWRVWKPSCILCIQGWILMARTRNFISTPSFGYFANAPDNTTKITSFPQCIPLACSSIVLSDKISSI